MSTKPGEGQVTFAEDSSFASMNGKFRPYFALIGLLTIFLSAGFIISVKTPLLRGRDELAHFRFIRFIVEHDRLPVTWEEKRQAGYKAEWPPLFHLIVATIGQGIDISAPPFVNSRLTENNPRVQLVFGPDKIKFAQALVTEDPYQGELLLWYLGRWITLITGSIGIALTYLFVRNGGFANIWLGLSATASLAFTVSYIRDSSVISYDPLLAIPIIIYLLLLNYTLQTPTQSWGYIGLGLLMGLAGLTKYTPLPAAFIVPVLIIWLAYQHQWSIRVSLWRIALFRAYPNNP